MLKFLECNYRTGRLPLCRTGSFSSEASKAVNRRVLLPAMETYKDDREEILSRQIKLYIGRAGRRNKCVHCLKKTLETEMRKK